MKNCLQKTIKIFVLLTVALGINSCQEVLEALTPADVFISSIIESGPETGGARTVEVALNKTIGSDVTFEFEYSGTAINNQDYRYTTTQITIPAGETTANISFFLIDNDLYEPDADKTVIIELIKISGEGVELVSFGDFTKHTFNIQEDDMQVVLTWVPVTGLASNYDLDLYILKDGLSYRSSSSSVEAIESVIIPGSASDANYDASAIYFGSFPDVNVDYTVTLNFPNGSTLSSSDSFTPTRGDDRTLWQIVKDGTSYSASENPYGSNGRTGGSSIQNTKK